MKPRILSLFAGYGGLDMAVEEVTGGTVAYVADIDPGACKVLAHRYPDAPNLGDVTTADWDALVGKVEAITGGSPCQDLSHAGRRAGGQRVVNAHRERRKVVRVADMMGGES